MPSTRGAAPDFDGLPNDYSDDSDDPDYREGSETEDDIPKSMERDRAQWIVDNADDLGWLYRKLLEDGRSVFGQSFLQTCSINAFANFVYINTTPFSE